MWKAARHSKFGLDPVFTTPKMCNFPHFWTCRSFRNIQTIIFFIFGLAAVVTTPELSIFHIFGRARAKSCHFQIFLKQLRMPRNIFSYFGKRHSKLSSVKTITIHFHHFFEFREFPQHPNYPSFSHFLNSESSHNTQTIQVSPFFEFREFPQHPNCSFFPIF